MGEGEGNNKIVVKLVYYGLYNTTHWMEVGYRGRITNKCHNGKYKLKSQQKH